MNQSLIPNGPNEVMTFARAFAESGLFQDTRDAAKAFVRVQAGAELGLAPFQSMNGIHIISGKPVLGAGVIASVIKRSGRYTYKIVEHSAEICKIEFFERFGEKLESIGFSTFTIQQAKKAGVKNLDKYPENMLFARAISNGAKWHTPDIFGGPVYTDGEIEAAPAVEETTATVVETQSVRQILDENKKGMGLLKDIEDVIAAGDAHTPEDFQKLLAKLKDPTLSSLSRNNQIQWFNFITEAASQLGIDYDRVDKKFFARPEPDEPESEEGLLADGMTAEEFDAANHAE